MTDMTSRFPTLVLAATGAFFFSGMALAEEPFFWGRAKCETDADCPQYTVCADYIEECGASLHEWGSDNCACPDPDNGPGWEEMPCYCHKCDGPNSGPVETGIKLCHMPDVECETDSECTQPGMECYKYTHRGECGASAQLVSCDDDADCEWGWECIDHSWWSVCYESDAGTPPTGACCLERVCAPSGWGHPVAGCGGGGSGTPVDVTSESGVAEADPSSPNSGSSSSGGCSAGVVPGAASWGLVVLLLLILLPVAIRWQRRRGRTAYVVVLAFLPGLLAGCDSESQQADVGSSDVIVDAMAGDDAAGQSGELDVALSEETNADEASPGDPEFAAYCQGIVDAFRALYEDLELPDNLAQENPPPVKTGDELDPNQFFTVLDRLQMEEGWTLDFTYFYASDMGGEPTLVARKTDSPLCQSDPEQPCVSEDVMLHVLVDGTQEGWFQLMVLKFMGDQFYREWHGFEGKIILPSKAGLTFWLEGQKKRWSVQDGEDFDEAAMAALEVEPVVDIGADSVYINLVYFSHGAGMVRWIADLETAPPYSYSPKGEHSAETLFECAWCGVP